MGGFSRADKANLFIFSIGTKIQCISLRYCNKDTYEVNEAGVIEQKSNDTWHWRYNALAPLLTECPYTKYTR